MNSDFGRISCLGPALGLNLTPPGFTRPPVKPGTDAPAWAGGA
jgi:hypothetical protein